eukprot:TRINITY_DN244051_c0_g1_i4.p1 TRINITY_DN244051_c0_g1~~TRINITY_DN244051_c0_g1_i4.p1  ORF type:complete len:210 (+),score=59.90 TRINITY_DN244051_c0_g1_i4:507-1136(+)
MEIGNNTSTFGYNVDYFSRATAQRQAVTDKQGIEQDTRGLENNQSSTQTNSDQSQDSSDSTKLTSEENAQLSELKTIDAKVRAHEAAHQSGPAAAGGASFTYSKGSDGVMYAVGGEVPVRVETGSTPEETLVNLQGVIATALAPADPSPQDVSIASKARVMMMQAQQELSTQIQEEKTNTDEYSQNAKNQYEQNSSISNKEQEDNSMSA